MRIFRILLASLIFSSVLGQLGKLPLGSFEGGVYLMDLLAALLVGWWLYWSSVKERRLRLPPLWQPIVLFVFVALLSWIWGWRWVGWPDGLVGLMYLARWIIYSLVYFATWNFLRWEPLLRRSLIDWFLMAVLVFAGLGFLQLVLLPDFSPISRLGGWDPHRNRLASTFLDPNFAGAFLVLGLTLVFSRLLYQKERRFCLILTTGYLLLATVLTFSRSAWGMLAIILGVFGIFRSRKILGFALLGAFLAYFAVPRIQTRIVGITDPADSARLRLVSWGQTWRIARENLFLGVGFNNFRYAQREQGFFEPRLPWGGQSGAGSDSSLLLVLATTGLVGLIVYLGIYGGLFFEVYRRCANPPALALLAALAGLFLESSFINSLFYPPIMLFVWLLAALSFSK